MGRADQLLPVLCTIATHTKWHSEKTVGHFKILYIRMYVCSKTVHSKYTMYVGKGYLNGDNY